MTTYVKYEGLGTTTVSLSTPGFDFEVTDEDIVEVVDHVDGLKPYASLSQRIKTNYIAILYQAVRQGLVVQTWDRAYVVRQRRDKFVSIKTTFEPTAYPSSFETEPDVNPTNMFAHIYQKRLRSGRCY